MNEVHAHEESSERYIEEVIRDCLENKKTLKPNQDERYLPFSIGGEMGPRSKIQSIEGKGAAR